MEKQIIRNVSGHWNEDDRIKIACYLVKAGYTVRIGRWTNPKTGKNEIVVEYWS